MSGTVRALFMDYSDEENMGAGSWLCTLCSPGANQVANHLSHCPQCGTGSSCPDAYVRCTAVPASIMEAGRLYEALQLQSSAGPST